MEKLWCEECGEAEQEVCSTHAGLCGECYGAGISEMINETCGDHICGHPLYVAGRVVAVCTMPHGIEHAHGNIQGMDFPASSKNEKCGLCGEEHGKHATLACTMNPTWDWD